MGGLDGLGYLPATSAEGGGVVGCAWYFPGSSAEGEIVVGLAFTGAKPRWWVRLGEGGRRKEGRKSWTDSRNEK